MKTITATILSLFFSFYALAQQQITNITYQIGDKSSTPAGFVEFNNLMYFAASNESFGRELWISNGSTNNAYLLKDINSGKNSGINTTFGNSSVVLNNTLYFAASNGTSAGEIWKSDGTENGTEIVTSFINYPISHLTLVGEDIFFLTQSNGLLSVWKSDGTEEGTQIIIGGLSITNGPSFQSELNDLFIFTFETAGWAKVWRSDGTEEGTFPITEEMDDKNVISYIESNNELYFVFRDLSVFDNTISVGIMKTDGTLENTLPIKAIHEGNSRYIDYADAIEINNKLYFSFFEEAYNRLFIWESDGTESGTTKIYDENSDQYYMPSNLKKNNSSLIFSGVNQSGGTSLLDLNINDLILTEIKELATDAEAPNIFSDESVYNIAQISSGKFFISAIVDRYSSKGWVSELTSESTKNITSLDNVSTIFLNNDAFYFAKQTEETGSELWKSDGTENNTFLIDNINKSKYGLDYTALAKLNDQLIFSAWDIEIGAELWEYNNNYNNLNLLKDIRPGFYGSLPRDFVNFDNELYFVANDGVHGYELWKTNGTTEGSTLVHEVISGTSYAPPIFPTTHGDNLFFVVYSGGSYLFKTDGVEMEALQFLGFNEYGVGYRVNEVLSSGDYLYFTTTGSGTDLWRSDGTDIGTIKIKDFLSLENMTDVNGTLYFSAKEVDGSETELWLSIGNSSDTKLVKNIGDDISSNPQNLIYFNNSLFFSAYTLENGRELWKTDGTETGTIQIIDINLGIESSVTDLNFSSVSNLLFFSANDGVNGTELWKTDGTEQGTSMVKDIYAGTGSSIPSNLTTVADRLYFQAFNEESGSELWKTDGTDFGTILTAEILDGPESSSPTDIISIGNDLFFIAESNADGRQIFKFGYDLVQSSSDLRKDISVSVYPNPSIDYLFINSQSNITEIIIYDIAGALIRKESISNDNKIDISDLNPGVYLLKYAIDGKEMINKIVKK